ncbi:MAG: inorganic diphosphatase [Alphaproteobacteria bacterium]|jgi:inorganic pyrophosphatase|nr:inorganic diphosphatase [Candidatus Jidaibacter sp.]
MDINKISSGNSLPDICNVVIEIPMDSGPIKYEFCKESGAIIVDRFMPTSMSYPCNYGFIPHTLSGDGDPVDVLVYSRYPLVPGSVISVKPIGVLVTEDEKGQDEKVLAVPHDKVDPFAENINSLDDIPNILKERISHFFENYKSLEKGKWVKVRGWEGVDEAKKVIMDAKKREGTKN